MAQKRQYLQRYVISYDLDSNKIRQLSELRDITTPAWAWKDVQKYLMQHGFYKLQGSAYVSREKLTATAVENVKIGLFTAHPWLKSVYKDFNIAIYKEEFHFYEDANTYQSPKKQGILVSSLDSPSEKRRESEQPAKENTSKELNPRQQVTKCPRVLNKTQIAYIHTALESGSDLSLKEIGDLFNVSAMTISRIINGINADRIAQGLSPQYLKSQENYVAHDETRYIRYRDEMKKDKYCHTPEEWKEILQIKNYDKYKRKLYAETGLIAPSKTEVERHRLELAGIIKKKPEAIPFEEALDALSKGIRTYNLDGITKLRSSLKEDPKALLLYKEAMEVKGYIDIMKQYGTKTGKSYEELLETKRGKQALGMLAELRSNLDMYFAEREQKEPDF